MPKKNSLLKDIEDLVNIYAYKKAQKEKERREKNIIKSIKLVEDCNEEINNDLYNYKHILKDIELHKFDVNGYYNKMMPKLKLKPYVPLQIPNEYEIRKQAHCLKKNIILEFLIKSRKEKRLENGKKFEKIWEKEYSEYQKLEKENKNKYDIYKQSEIQKNDKLVKEILAKKQKYLNRDSKEMFEIMKTFEFRINNEKSIKQCALIYEDGIIEANLEFINPDTDLNIVKEHKYLKAKDEFKEIYYTKKELENIFETIVFNTILSVTAQVQYYFGEQIDSVIANSYVDKINTVNGNKEKFYFCSVKINNGDIPFDKLDLLNSKDFLDSKGATYNLPLIALKRINKYRTHSVEPHNSLNNNLSNINGFDFEKLSKILLEKNGFYNVEVTKASQDYGADVIAYKDDVKYAIQCKNYSGKVGVRAVQEVIASKSMYKCHVGVVLTNSYFTPNAIKLAENNNVILWNKSRFLEMVNNSKIFENKSSETLNDSINNNDYDLNNNESYISENIEDNIELDEDYLTDDERELVENGEYESWNFEYPEDTDELDEDDYYFEDDK